MVLPTEEFVLTQQIRSGVDNQALYPLTSAQHEVWFDQLLHRDMPLCNIGRYVPIPATVLRVFLRRRCRL
jgi:hypothetical protein